ncbi:MAG: hypothetical protein H0U74_07315 [Bradymonadaceae bacterium]|nr:hypothetical protein [Lujinxingiaceae bacterium]
MNVPLKRIWIAILGLSLSVGCVPVEDDTTNNSNNANNNTNNANNTSPQGWQTFELEVPGDRFASGMRVTGVWCDAANSCVYSVDTNDGHGYLGSASSEGVTGVVLDGATVATASGANFNIRFLGFNKTSAGLVARVDSAASYVSAAGAITAPESWSTSTFGVNGDGDFRFGNKQWMIASAADGKWRYIYNGVLWGADSAPGPETLWTGLWSPDRNPSFPADYLTRKGADPTLCGGAPQMNILPSVTQFAAISADMGTFIYPANAINQGGGDPSGVCVSTNAGVTFNQVPFDGLGDELGPKAVYCVGGDKCWAYNALPNDVDSVFIYYTTNASAGANMTWTRATLPVSVPNEDVQFNHIFFAPDATNGWMVGSIRNNAMLLNTTDGGQTWTNLSGGVMAKTDTVRLHSGFALDANKIWIGGEKGTFLYHANGGK